MSDFKVCDKVRLPEKVWTVVCISIAGLLDLVDEDSHYIDSVPPDILTRVNPPKPDFEIGQVWRDGGIIILIRAVDDITGSLWVMEFVASDGSEGSLLQFHDEFPNAELVNL